MDYRNILATGFLLLCGGYFFQSLQPANATLPPYPVGTSYNSYPYESIQCNGCTQSTPFLTVPSDKSFIITTAVDTSNPCELFINNLPVEVATGRLFLGGKAKLLAPPNSTISTNSYTCYIEGYYAESNNNNLVSFYGDAPPNSYNSIVTIPNDKNLIITGVSFTGNSYNVAIYSDSNVMLILRSIYHSESAFNLDEGHLVIPPNTVLSIENTHSSTNSKYYIQGHYAPL